jgi:hypothetical protein
MKLQTQCKIVSIFFAALGLVIGTNPVNATTMTAQWFTVASGDPDFPGSCCNVYSNEVQSTLGANGLPVYNSSYGGPTLHDVNSTTGELTWWSPTLNSNVTYTGSSTITVPIGQNMFPPNGTGSTDSNGYQTAILTGYLTVPTTETVTFNLGSDDDSFLALDNTIVAQVGGIHGSGTANYTTGVLSPGQYLLTLFYADRYQVNAYLDFSVSTTNVSLDSTTPLPAALPLFATGLGGLGLLGWRRKRKAVALAG